MFLVSWLGVAPLNVENERQALLALLPSREEAVSDDSLGKWAMNLMLINVSTRKYGRAVRLPEGGISAQCAQRLGCVQIGGVPPQHFQNVNATISRFKNWLPRFNGVASKYLPNYLAWRRRLETGKIPFRRNDC
jgi:hypothetical protein